MSTFSKREGNFERRSGKGERERRKTREVDKECESHVTFWREKMIDISDFLCASRAIVTKSEK